MVLCSRAGDPLVSRFAKAVLLVAAGLLTSACAGGQNLVVARDPIPPPSANFAVVCRSTGLILNAYYSSCTPILRGGVITRRTVVRARG